MRIFFIILCSFCLSKTEAQNFFKKLAKDAGNTFTGAVRTTGNVYQESTAPFRNVTQDFYKNNFQKPVDNIKNGNYSVPKVAILCNAYKTLFPFLIDVSMMDLITANTFAL